MNKDEYKPVLRAGEYGWVCKIRGGWLGYGGHTPQLAYNSWAYANPKLVAKNKLRIVK